MASYTQSDRVYLFFQRGKPCKLDCFGYIKVFSMLKWLMALRVKTLTAAVIPVVVGTAVVGADNRPVYWLLSVWALLSALFIQIGTNLLNDAIDFKKGADTKERIGPQRVTQSGLLSSKRVVAGGVVSLLIALLLGIPLVIRGGEVILIIGLLSLFFAYTYTGGPFPLAYKGLGDLFVILFFGIIAVCGVYYLHTLTFSWSAFVASLQVGFLSAVLIAVNNLRDMAQDRLVNKKTLAVRFGQGFARLEILFLILSSFALLCFWALDGKWLAMILPLMSLPLCRSLLKGIYMEKPGPIYNQYLSKAALIHALFGLQLALGLLL